MIHIDKRTLRSFSHARAFQCSLNVPLAPCGNEIFTGMMCYLQYASALEDMVAAFRRREFDLADHYFRCATRVFLRKSVDAPHV